MLGSLKVSRRVLECGIHMSGQHCLFSHHKMVFTTSPLRLGGCAYFFPRKEIVIHNDFKMQLLALICKAQPARNWAMMISVLAMLHSWVSVSLNPHQDTSR